VALLVAAVAWPFVVSRGTVDIATLTMIYVILGLGLNVVVGLSGLLVLGYGGFYAIGAYTFALLNHYYGLGFWTSAAGWVGFAAAGFLLGFPVLRLRGDYLAIVTLGFGEIVRILLLNNTEVWWPGRYQPDPETDLLRSGVQPYRPRRWLGYFQQLLWYEV
jgi:branched-chain amino acid transport system permease protein